MNDGQNIMVTASLDLKKCWHVNCEFAAAAVIGYRKEESGKGERWAKPYSVSLKMDVFNCHVLNPDEFSADGIMHLCCTWFV